VVCLGGGHVALLKRTLIACGVASLLPWTSGCANVPAGDLQLEYGTEEGKSEPRTGWMFVGGDGSRFDGGTLLYGEFIPFAGGLAIIELDLSTEPEARPVLRYQERRKGNVTFDGEAVAGEIQLPRDLEAQDCDCSAVEFALLFKSGDEQRFIDTAHLGLNGGHCAERVHLDDLEGPVRIERADLCAVPHAAPAEPAPRPQPSPDVHHGDDADRCTSSDPYYPCPGTVTYVASEDSGCSSTEDDSGGGCEGDSDNSSTTSSCEGDSDDSGTTSGCESDSSEAEGCSSSDDTGSDACGEDTTDGADACSVSDAGAVGGTAQRLGRLHRRRVPGGWTPQQSSGLTIACALIVPWLRGGGLRRRRRKSHPSSRKCGRAAGTSARNVRLAHRQ